MRATRTRWSLLFIRLILFVVFQVLIALSVWGNVGDSQAVSTIWWPFGIVAHAHVYPLLPSYSDRDPLAPAMACISKIGRSESSHASIESDHEAH